MTHQPGTPVWAKLSDGVWWRGRIVTDVEIGANGTTNIRGRAPEPGYVVDIGPRAVVVEARRVTTINPASQGQPTNDTHRHGTPPRRMEVRT